MANGSMGLPGFNPALSFGAMQEAVQTPPSAPPPPAQEDPPAPVADLAPQDTGITVTFGAQQVAVTDNARIPALAPATQANVNAFLKTFQDATPTAVTRTGDFYVINVQAADGAQTIKARTAMIEEAVANSTCKPDGKLVHALQLSELMTSVDLPSAAQGAIRKQCADGSPVSFAMAQHNAILAACVEKFAKILPQAQERVDGRYAAKPDVQSAWNSFKTALTEARTSGDYSAVFDRQNEFLGVVGPQEAESPWFKPQVPDRVLPPSNIIAAAHDARLSFNTAVAKVDSPLTELDKQAIADPRAFLKSKNNDWNAVRALYRSGQLTHPGAGMQALLNFRQTVTEDLLRQVRDETKAHVIKERTAINQKLAASGSPVRLETDPAKIAPLAWGAAGSTDATSDIDVSLSGEGTEFASQRFNELFREQWETDSGIAFDVNVYARDFVPQLNKMGFYRSSSADTLDSVRQASAESTIKWDTDIRNTAFEAPFQAFQEKQSFYAVRSHMEPKEWEAFKQNQLDAVGQLPVGKQDAELRRLNTVFGEVEQQFRDHNDTVAAVAKNLVNFPFDVDREAPHATLHALEHHFEEQFETQHHRAPDPTEKAAIKLKAERLALQAENTIYDNCLAENARQRNDLQITKGELTAMEAELQTVTDAMQLPANQSNPATMATLTDRKTALETAIGTKRTEVQQKTFDLKCAISNSLTYANETYATEAALLHTVGNKQMLSKGVYADKGSKPALGKIKLNEQQITQAFREQIGMSFKELTRRDSMGEALIMGGKYIHRAMNAAKHIQKMTGVTVPGPPGLDFLRFLAKETVATKKDGKVKDLDKGEAVMKDLENWIRANPDQGVPIEAARDPKVFKAVLMTFEGNVQKSLQSWIAQDRPQPAEARQFVPLVNPDVRVPDASYRAKKGRASEDQVVAVANLGQPAQAVMARVLDAQPQQAVVSEGPQPQQGVLSSDGAPSLLGAAKLVADAVSDLLQVGRHDDPQPQLATVTPAPTPQLAEVEVLPSAQQATVTPAPSGPAAVDEAVHRAQVASQKLAHVATSKDAKRLAAQPTPEQREQAMLARQEQMRASAHKAMEKAASAAKERPIDPEIEAFLRPDPPADVQRAREQNRLETAIDTTKAKIQSLRIKLVVKDKTLSDPDKAQIRREIGDLQMELLRQQEALKRLG